MLTSVLGVLLAASLGSGPHAVAPEDVCLMDRCDDAPVFCLVAPDGCRPAPGDRICLVTECTLPPAPRLRGLQP